MSQVSCGGGTASTPGPPPPPPQPAPNTDQMVVVGATDSTNFSTTNGALAPNYMGNTDGFIASVRLNASAAPPQAQVTFSSYFGGSGLDQVRDVFVDGQGNLYVTGRSASPNLPVTPGAPQPNNRGGTWDAYVAKISSTGQLVFCTYLGGVSADVGYGIFVDTGGFIYVSGRTSSADFPIAGNPVQPTYAGGKSTVAPYFGGDFFVTKMRPDGSGLVWSTFIGGSDDDAARGRVLVDSAGNVYVQGGSESADFPVRNAFQPTRRGMRDGIVAKLSPDGSQLIYSSYLGGNEVSIEQSVGGVVVNSAGEAYFCSDTTAPTGFPTTPGAFQTTMNGTRSGAIVKVSATGMLLAATLLGGNGESFCQGIALDASGNPVVLEVSSSTDFPTTPGVYQAGFQGGSDLTVTKFTPALSALLFSTFVGASGTETADTSRLELDSSGNIYILGSTDSTNFPVTSDAIQRNYGGGAHDTIVVKLSANGSQLLYATYLGGSGDDFGRAVRYRRN